MAIFKSMPATFRNKIFLIVFCSLLIASCRSSWQSSSVQYTGYSVDGSKMDTSVVSLLKSYGDSVSKTMNYVIGYAATTLEKKLPEGSLGNFMVDVMHLMATEKFNTRVDAAFVNYGGIRLQQLVSGEITVGKIYELMPFDNLIVLQKVPGTTLQEFLDLFAARGGWPVAGITMKIKNKKAVDVMINGKPLVPTDMYVIANSDYVANGGDNAEMLKSIPQQNLGYLFRDALLEFIKRENSQGRKINASVENRIVNVQ